MKKLLQNLSLVCASLAVTLVLIEIAMHFLPVSSGLSFLAVDDAQPILKAQANRDITYSKDWDFKLVTHKHVNNDGFLNTQDYIQNDPKPLVAVVGDSFVEGLQLNDDEPYYVHLAAQDKLRVYSFGFSGAPLSQYLIWSQYAKQQYNNSYLIINVVGNDFDESLKKYKFANGFYHYTPNADNILALERNDLNNTPPLRNFARKSKLISYLIRNVEIAATPQKIKNKFKSRKVNYGNVTTNESNEQYLQDSYAGIDAFFRDLPKYAGLESKNVAFVIDDRTITYGNEMTSEELADTYFYKMKGYFIERAHALGYTVIDMRETFNKHFQEHQQHFEFSCDYHWNALGHKVVADAIQATTWWRNLTS